MQVEFDALQRTRMWSLVPSTNNVNIVGCKSIFRIKYKAAGSVERNKARLMTKGFTQTPEFDVYTTFSPIMKRATINIVLSLAVTNNWDIQQIYVNSDTFIFF